MKSLNNGFGLLLQNIAGYLFLFTLQTQGSTVISEPVVIPIESQIPWLLCEVIGPEYYPLIVVS